jgi:allantoinase/DNA mismatch repair protein MutS2
MVASAKGRLVSALAVAAALAAVLLYRAPFSKVPGIISHSILTAFHVSLLCPRRIESVAAAA